MQRNLSLLLMLAAAACGSSSVSTPAGASPPDASVPDAPDAGPPGLSLGTLAGALGGSGNADDLGPDARFQVPIGVVGDGAGNLYVVDGENQVIRKIVISTGVVTTVAGDGSIRTSDGTGKEASFNFPWGITYASGSLFVTEIGSHDIRKVDLVSGEVTTFAGTPGVRGATDGPGAQATFDSPEGLVAAGGSLYVADSGNRLIRKIEIASTTVTTLAGLAGVSGIADGVGDQARFSLPNDIAADQLGNLFVSDPGSSTIRKIAIASRGVTKLAGTPGTVGSADGTGGAALFHSPGGIASDGADHVFVADTVNQTIRRISVSSGVVSTFSGVASIECSVETQRSRLCFPLGIALEGGTLYAADGLNAIRAVAPDGSVDTLAGRGRVAGSTDGRDRRSPPWQGPG
jgi:sugar lactone lactonase YvrE